MTKEELVSLVYDNESFLKITEELNYFSILKEEKNEEEERILDIISEFDEAVNYQINIEIKDKKYYLRIKEVSSEN